ncbi:MAG: hypothetical protein GTN38_03575 [Candidatus Aenigmarchaeota archaeon]|nr:hypothetical protein [Candidatus Aenigmarchaeota archaeon]
MKYSIKGFGNRIYEIPDKFYKGDAILVNDNLIIYGEEEPRFGIEKNKKFGGYRFGSELPDKEIAKRIRNFYINCFSKSNMVKFPPIETIWKSWEILDFLGTSRYYDKFIKWKKDFNENKYSYLGKSLRNGCYSRYVDFLEFEIPSSSVWSEKDIELAEKILNLILVKKPGNIDIESVAFVGEKRSNKILADFLINILSPYKKIMLEKVFCENALNEKIKNLRNDRRINKNNILTYCDGMLTVESAKRIVSANKILEDTGKIVGDEIEAAFIFGSVAEGMGIKESDTDAVIITKNGDLFERAGGRDLERKLLRAFEEAERINRGYDTEFYFKSYKIYCREIESIQKKVGDLAYVMKYFTLDDPWIIAIETSTNEKNASGEDKYVWRLRNEGDKNTGLRFIMAGPKITLCGDDLVKELETEARKAIKKYGEEDLFFESLCGKSVKSMKQKNEAQFWKPSMGH